MTKREIINDIMEINLSAGAEFLSRFSDNELNEYLQHLHILREPRMTYGGDLQTQEDAACKGHATPVLLHERELGRWDEYLDRVEIKAQKADSEPEIFSEPKETVDCVPTQSESDSQAWLF